MYIMFSQIMRNKKDLYIANCINELNMKTDIPEKIKGLNVLS